MNAQQEALVEQLGGSIAENLFSGPFIKQRIEQLQKTLKHRIPQYVVTLSEMNEEVTKILEQRKDFEKLSHQEQELAALEAAKEVLDKRGKKKFILPMAESQEDDLTEDDLRERFKLTSTLLISEVSNEIGRSLTEAEVNEVGLHLLENSMEGRALAVQAALEKDHPEIEILATYPDKVIFEGGDGLYSVGYRIEKGKVELSEVKEMERALIPRGSIDQINDILRKKPTGGYTEEQKFHRRIAGIVEEVLPPPKTEPINEAELTLEQRRDRWVAGIGDYYK